MVLLLLHRVVFSYPQSSAADFPKVRGVALYEISVVGYDQHRAFESCQRAFELSPRGKVEVIERFIQQ